jgi:DNA-binding transcriptional regulator WhiA
MKTLLSLLFLAYSGFALAQPDLSELDKQCFLIGTLDDYMGHQQTFTATIDSSYYQMVDVYFQNQKNIALLIDSLFKGEYNDLYMTNSGAPKGIRLYSRTLSGKINDYYNYLPSRTFTLYHDTIYTGYIKQDHILTKSEKLSFLTGAFLRACGKTDANEYFLSIPNSAGKAKLCAKLLQEFNCPDVKHIVSKNNIPVGNLIYFKPSEEILNIIKKVEAIKNGWRKD